MKKNEAVYQVLRKLKIWLDLVRPCDRDKVFLRIIEAVYNVVFYKSVQLYVRLKMENKLQVELHKTKTISKLHPDPC